MERWFEDCAAAANIPQAERVEGARCPDCGSGAVRVAAEDGGGVRVMDCAALGHRFWFVRAREPCARCGCEWTDASKAQKQLRKADEASTVTVVCMRGCTVARSS